MDNYYSFGAMATLIQTFFATSLTTFLANSIDELFIVVHVVYHMTHAKNVLDVFIHFQHMVQTGMTSPYPAFPQQNGGGAATEPPHKQIAAAAAAAAAGDMKAAVGDLVSPSGGPPGGGPGGGGGGGGGGGPQAPPQPQQTNGQLPPEQTQQQGANPAVSQSNFGWTIERPSGKLDSRERRKSFSCWDVAHLDGEGNSVAPKFHRLLLLARPRPRVRPMFPGNKTPSISLPGRPTDHLLARLRGRLHL